MNYLNQFTVHGVTHSDIELSITDDIGHVSFIIATHFKRPLEYKEGTRERVHIQCYASGGVAEELLSIVHRGSYVNLSGQLKNGPDRSPSGIPTLVLIVSSVNAPEKLLGPSRTSGPRTVRRTPDTYSEAGPGKLSRPTGSRPHPVGELPPSTQWGITTLIVLMIANIIVLLILMFKT